MNDERGLRNLCSSLNEEFKNKGESTKNVFVLKVSYGTGGILCENVKDLLDAIQGELDCEDHINNLAKDGEHLSIHVAAMTQEQIDNAPEFGGW